MFVRAAYKSNTFKEAPRFLIELCFLIILTLIITLNISETDGINSILPLLVVYLAAGLRLLPGFVKLNSYLQTTESYKPSLNLIYTEFKKNNFESNIKDRKYYSNNNFNLGDISFKNVDFSFGKKKIFEDLNLVIKRNSILGISGNSGSGKSTLINILLGLLKVNKGKVLVDNLDIEDSLDQWQKSIGYVSQNIFLLDATLKENIAFGVPIEKINYHELNRVIEYANLTDFLKNLSDGLDTNIGEKGSKISGGQTQRIAIARELYHRPSVLIFDEATTGLDEKTEIQIFKSIEKLKNKITIIIVSHNQNTLKVCDEVFDLNQLKKERIK
jgi:ABC-type multidrug transport system fused ATPase/permease subunit